MHYYSHHLGDYAKDTGHLSLAEHGAYRMLLDHYYSTETGLPENLDSMCRICRATSKAERQAVESVLRQFFFSEEKTFKHRRVEREISEFRQRAESAAKAGKLSGEARRMKAEQRTSVERPLNGRSISVAHSVEQRGSVEPSINHKPRTNVLLEKEPKGETSPTPPVKIPSKRQQIETDIAAADREPLPLELSGQPFRDAWADWCLHRAELYRRNPAKRWSSQAARNTLTECARNGAELAVMAINAAIANGWQGIVWDRLQPTNGSGNSAKWTAPKNDALKYGPVQPDKWKIPT